MSTNTNEATVESVRPVIVVGSDPRGVDIDNGEEIVCSVGSSILCAALTKVSLTSLEGYIRRVHSVHMEERMTNEYINELLKCCEIIHCSITAVILHMNTYVHKLAFCGIIICSISVLVATVVIDSYTRNSTLTSGDSVPLGTQIILVCWVVGLPYGTPLSYTWTCQNGPCEVEGYYGRKVHNEHILAVNTMSTSDGGTYTCQVTATGGQEATGNFTLRVTGMRCRVLQLYIIYHTSRAALLQCAVASISAKAL